MRHAVVCEAAVDVPQLAAQLNASASFWVVAVLLPSSRGKKKERRIRNDH